MPEVLDKVGTEDMKNSRKLFVVVKGGTGEEDMEARLKAYQKFKNKVDAIEEYLELIKEEKGTSNRSLFIPFGPLK